MTHDGEEYKDGVIIFPFIAIIFGLLLDGVNKKLKFLNIPDSVLQFVFALVASVFICWCLPADMIHVLDKWTWRGMAPDIVLTVLLPPLMFESSFKINAHTFFAKIWFIVLLTVFVYIFTLGIAAGFLFPVMIFVNQAKYSAVLIFLSIIVATDPVAVVAMLEQLRILIEGESLLNDGLALTVYRILEQVFRMEMEVTTALDWSGLIRGFIMCILVTPILAMVIAWMCAWLVSKLESHKARQGLIIVAVYGVFILFNKIEGSSALGLVFFGITLNYYKEEMPPDTTERVLQVWEALGYCANNVIFIFSGYIVGREIFHDNELGGAFLAVDRMDIFCLIEGICIFCIPLLARSLSIIFFYCIYDLTRKKGMKPLPKSDYVILSYAGLRGALGLILALELNKPGRLHEDTKVILFLTSATTVACLIIQGMTFSAVAQKEGTTKRSRYTRESNQKLSKCLKASLDENMNVMKKKHTAYLHGTNWNGVAELVKGILRVHEQKMDEEVKDCDDFDEDGLWEGIIDEDEEAHELRVKKRNETDAKIGLYGILLAKVRESWRVGEASGKTAHIIISLLEHGIDEGTITVQDMQDYLRRLDNFCGFNSLLRLANTMYDCLLRHRDLLDKYVGLAGHSLFHEADKPEMLMDRGFEKWFLLHSLIFIAYTVYLGVTTFTVEGTRYSYSYVTNLLYIPLCFSTITEFIYTFALRRERQQEAVNRGMEVSSKEIPFEVANVLFMLIGTGLILFLQFNGDRHCNKSPDSFECLVTSYVVWLILLSSTLYRTSRMLPLAVVLTREHFQFREQRSERVRLSMLIYLTYLMKNADFPKELFSEAAYKIVRMEGREFTRIIDANLRNELKQHSKELDLISVIKSRQAARMMSYKLKNKLREMRLRGFTPEDVEERWDGIVEEIKSTADKMLTVPELDYEEWLERLPWLDGLSESSRIKANNLLVQELSMAEAKPFQSGKLIPVNDASLVFVKKGICKVTEGVTVDNSHEFYVHQGELMGQRNLMLFHMMTQPPAKRNWSPLLPHRIYEATTYVEICYLDNKFMKKLLAITDIYKNIARFVQIKRIVSEVRHHHASSELSLENFMKNVADDKKGVIFTSETVVHVKQKHMAIVGCWTVLNVVRASDNRPDHLVIDANRHIIGPADIALAPVDDRCEGMVYFISYKTAVRNQERRNSTSSADSTYEKSNYSIMQDGGRSFIKKKIQSVSNNRSVQ